MHLQLTKACPFCAEQIQPAAVVCRHCGNDLVAAARRTLPPPRPNRQEESSLVNVLVGVAAVAVFAAAGLFMWRQAEPVSPVAAEPLPAPAPVPLPPPPLVVPVLDEPAMQVPAGTAYHVSFALDDPRTCILTGHVLGLTGGKRDVEVFVLDQDGFVNWSNGTSGEAIFHGGRSSASSLNVLLPGPGEYHLLVSNRFSVVSDKTVQVEDALVTCS
ncbi:MAG: hypothetical protein ABW277_05630 [Longimicrobiaceae bacterium]